MEQIPAAASGIDGTRAAASTRVIAPTSGPVGNAWRALLAVPLWLKIIGANIVIVAAAIAGTWIAAHDGATTRSLVGGVLVALALSTGVNVALVLIALRPLRALEEVAARVWRGNVDARVPPSLLADRDMARVGHTLNLLVDALTQDRARSRQLAAQIIRQSELEESRIGRELHESAAQRLAAQVLQIAAIARGTGEPHTREQLDALRTMTAETLEQLRGLAETMYPQVLDDLGLPAAIDRLARQAREKYPCEIRTSLEMHDPLPGEIASVLYGVAQEAIGAAVEGGRATRVDVALATTPRRAELVVQHDGARQADTPASVAVRHRVDLADGEYDVTRSEDIGTRITVSVPLIAMSNDRAFIDHTEANPSTASVPVTARR